MKFDIHLRLAPNADAGSPVVVFTSGNYMEAHFVASLLNSYELPALVIDDNICRVNVIFSFIVGGAKVVVGRENAELAMEALEAPRTRQLFCGQCMSLPMSLLAVVGRLLIGRRPSVETPEPPEEELATHS